MGIDALAPLAITENSRRQRRGYDEFGQQANALCDAFNHGFNRRFLARRLDALLADEHFSDRYSANFCFKKTAQSEHASL